MKNTMKRTSHNRHFVSTLLAFALVIAFALSMLTACSGGGGNGGLLNGDNNSTGSSSDNNNSGNNTSGGGSGDSASDSPEGNPPANSVPSNKPPVSVAPATGAPTSGTPTSEPPTSETPPDEPSESQPPPSISPPPIIIDSELYNAALNLPRSDAVDILWSRLSGFWTATDNMFAGFIYSEGLPCIAFGYFNSSWSMLGEFVDAVPTDAYKATIKIYVPAQPATMEFSARDEMWVDVYLDVSDLFVDGKIKIKIDEQGNGGWYQYAWGGNSFADVDDSVSLQTGGSYAQIVNWAERMDPETDFAFDFMDWIQGEDAITMYMQDHPGTTYEQALASVEEFGYIRNVNPLIRWFTTTPSTEYYIHDAVMNPTAIKVGYDEFRNFMIPALNNNDTAKTFVWVIYSGESLVKVEWVYHP